MAKALGGLLVRLGRRRSQQKGSPGDGPVVDADAMALDESAPLDAPPVLMPAVIFRQVLFDAAELTPAWARPRPAPVLDPGISSGPTAPKPSPKRTRQSKPNSSSVTSRPRTRRVAKPDPGATDG